MSGADARPRYSRNICWDLPRQLRQFVQRSARRWWSLSPPQEIVRTRKLCSTYRKDCLDGFIGTFIAHALGNQCRFYVPFRQRSIRCACYAVLVRLGVSRTCVSGRNRCRCRVPCTATSLPQPATINPWITARNREPPASGFAIL